MATAERNYSLNFSGRLPVEAQDGMKICYENSDPFWRTIINYCIWEAARKHAEFTVDQVIEQMDIVNAERAKKNQPLIETHNLAALGQAMKNSAKDGVIVATNATLRSKRPKSHGNLLRVWKSNFFTKMPPTEGERREVTSQGSSSSVAVPQFLNSERGNSGRERSEGQVEYRTATGNTALPAPVVE